MSDELAQAALECARFYCGQVVRLRRARDRHEISPSSYRAAVKRLEDKMYVQLTGRKREKK